MPKHIDTYKAKETPQDSSSGQGVRKVTGNTILMVIVVLALLWTSASDAYERVKEDHQGKIQKAKLCMAEYSQNSCDALKLSPKCGELR